MEARQDADRGARNFEAPVGFINGVDYFLTLLSERNVRFDAEITSVSTLLEQSTASLKDRVESLRSAIEQRLDETEVRHQERLGEFDLRYQQRFVESDLRYQQRFDQQSAALDAAAVAADKSVAAADKSVAAALESAERAVAKAEAANEKRFDSVNEFRAQLRDQAATFIPRIEAEQRLGQLSARLDELRTNDAQRTGRSAGGAALYGWIIGGIAAVATIIGIFSVLAH